MIREVWFRNFKAYRSLDVELEPFTVLVGPNASGKTTLLEGLRLISKNLSEKFRPESLWDARSYGTDTPAVFSIAGNWDGNQITAKMSHQVGSSVFVLNGTWAGAPFSIGPDEFNKGDSLREFRAALSATAVLNFEPRRLADPAYSEAEIPEVSPDGSGLAAVLAHLKLSDDEVFNEIEDALRQIVPAVRRIRIERAGIEHTASRTIALDEQRHQVSERRTVWGNRIVLDMRGAKGVAANAVGEGTLMALGLLTVLIGPTRPRLVLLDDIELALHPAAQSKLIEVLRSIQSRNTRVQLVATSHSPFILNYLDPKEVRMTFLAENGFARCEKLAAHPEFEKWKDLMSPGEFWSTVGESWLEKAGEASVSK